MSRTVPGDARQQWPHGEGRDKRYGEGQDVAGSGYSDNAGVDPEYDPQEHASQVYGGQAYGARAGNGQAYPGQGYAGQAYNGQAYDTRGYQGQAYDVQGYDVQGYGGRGYQGQAAYTDRAYDGQGYDGRAYQGQPAYDDRDYDVQGYNGRAYQGQPYDGQAYADQAYDGQGYDVQARNGRAHQGQAAYDDRDYDVQGYNGRAYQGQPYDGQARNGTARQGQAYDGQAHTGQAHTGQARNGTARQGQAYNGQGYNGTARQDQAYDGKAHPGQGYDTQGFGAPDRGQGGQTRKYAAAQPGYEGRGGGKPGISPPGRGRLGRRGGPGKRKVHFRRLRRWSHRPAFRVVAAILAVFLVWVMFSAGQATFKNTGNSLAANLAEWMRDHYLGPVVTFGEWMTYSPPKVGGKPNFSYAVPKNEQITVTKTKSKHKGFVPDIPATLKTLASGPPLAGEGQWRVVEKVKGQPAILTTFLRDGGQYTSYSNGIASIDQRLVRFSLRPGTEDPGPAPNSTGNWGVPNYIPAGQRTGLLATFNSGFKLAAANGGFYLNGLYHGSLINGAASVVYYKNGTIKIGEWGRDFTMNPNIVAVRQNLKLLVDHGKVAGDSNKNVETTWGATLGGSYWVWRSGIGITKDNRIVFVYGQALDALDLANLLQRAGAVEGMQLDINPAWMKFDYYQADGHPGNPTPVPLLPSQQPSPYSYYTPSTRDFTAVYAR